VSLGSCVGGRTVQRTRLAYRSGAELPFLVSLGSCSGGRTVQRTRLTCIWGGNETFCLPVEIHSKEFLARWACNSLQRQNAENLKQIFLEKEYRCLSPNFHIHMSVSELYIPTMGLPVLLEEIVKLVLGIYKSLKDTWMWKLGLRPRYSQKRNI